MKEKEAMQNDSKPSLIGLMTDHNPNLLVGLLAILKSGSGFVPIDPKYPTDRIDFIVSDCGIEILVTEEKWKQRAYEISRTNPQLKHVVCVDELLKDGLIAPDHKSEFGARDLKRSNGHAHPSDALYVIFTSGSTGVPKGVLITHENLTPLLLWSKRHFNLGEHTRVLQNLTYCFDFGVYEILTTLVFGGALYFLDKFQMGRSSGYADCIREHAINTIHSTPSFFKEFISGAGRLDGLEILHLGGEQLTEQRVEKIYETVGERCVVYNGYGPTEASVNSTIFTLGNKATRHGLNGNANGNASSIPIGRATASTRAYVLDRNYEPVPVGVAGELYVSGPGVSLGYINRPDLSAERFLPDPFGDKPGARLYRTGDLVRYLPDGNIEFLGRIDHQVKVRGFRIELGEICSVLTSHPGVRDAIVMAREDSPSDKRLVAYVITDDERTDSAELRAYLKERLPDYMAPSAFVRLAGFPLTPNGKVDRQALPAPGTLMPDFEEGFLAPRTPEEEMVSAICAEVLGLETIGVNNNLFTLGCQSILATRIIARLREVFQVELPLVALFEGPTAASLAESIRSARHTDPASQPPALKSEPRDSRLPLSFAQERLWFLSQLDPHSTSYHIPRAVRITGSFRQTTLEQTLTEMVRRHEMLRTTFPAIDGQPFQAIHPPYYFTVPLIDLRALPESEREAQAERLILEIGQRPFDIVNGPLMHVTMLQLSDQECVMSLTEHHLIDDGWTQGVFAHDFLALYSDFAAGTPSPLPDLPFQYADFACWQRDWLQGEVVERQLRYWREQLAVAPPVLELPADRPRPATQSFRGAEKTLILDGELAEGLRALSRREGITLFMTMLAAFDTLLYRYTGQSDIVTGSAISNRRWREIEGLIGIITNTLALRVDLSGDLTFRELLQRTRQVCLDAYAHQDVPFEKVVEDLRPERSLSYNPIFQVMFSFLDTPRAELELPGVTMDVIITHNQSAKFDLNVIVIPHAEQMAGEASGGEHGEITLLIEYNTDIFEEETVGRMFEHFRTLLEAAVLNPENHINRFSLLSERELEQILLDWNDTSLDFRLPLLVHHLFEAQVLRSPHSLALVSSSHQLSFSLLNRRANQLARLLLSAGLRPDSLVAICLDRCADMVLSLLAVLKAGAAYLPVDPLLPHHRISFMMEDARARLVITSRSLAHLFGSSVNTLFVEDLQLLALFDDSNLDIPVSPDNLAYVIYTSGSTGTPKAAMNTHRGLANRQLWAQQVYPLSDSDRLLQLSSFSFDFSFWEVLGSLSAGATLVLPDPGSQRDISLLVDLISDHRVTAVHFVPSQIQVFLAQDGLDRCSTLHTVLAGGEPLSFDLQQRFFDRLTASLHNQYGPTEASINVTHWHCQPDASNQIVPIGRPIANTRIYILDPSSQPVAQGAIGELCIGGLPVGRGYFNRPDATADKFIPDPFSQQPGARLYRTGDLARYLGGGVIGYHGRIDQQVKVRGFRIELGEIEAALRQHPEVREAVVVARQEAGGDKRLVGYVVGEAGATPKVVELREHVSRLLPEHMVPAAWVMMEGLPLTAGGKLDRRALPEPEQVRPELGSEYREPEGEVEREVAGIWESLLGVERVGAEDNFFELGGHSLLATQAVSRIKKAFEMEVSLRVMFERPTVRAVARAIEEALKREEEATTELATEPATEPMGPTIRSREMPLSFAQERLWFLDQFEPNNPTYNIPGAVRLLGKLDRPAIIKSLNEVVRRHESLRTYFTVTDGRPSQVIVSELKIAVRFNDLSHIPAQDQEQEMMRVVVEDAMEPFDLKRAPLIRAGLIKLSEEHHVLQLTMHHITSDGWSLGVLVKELTTLYGAYSQNRPSPLPELTTQYADYAVWQREWLSGRRLKEQLDYWKSQLGGELPVLQMPADKPRTSLPSYRGGRSFLPLPGALKQLLKDLSNREGATLFMTLLTAFKVLLYRYTGQPDILTGTPIANRNRLEVEGMIGFFVNTLVLRADLSRDPSFTDLLGRVRDISLQAYAHQDMPFERLVQQLHPQRGMAQQPIFQVMFVLQDALPLNFKVAGLTIAPLEIVNETAKFDLTLTVTDEPDRLVPSLEYKTDLFEEETARRILGHFQSLLESIVENPDRQISTLNILTPSEAGQLMSISRSPALPAAFAQGECLHELFERQARRTPNATAVVFHQHSLTFGELNRRADQLALLLRQSGIGPESLVGICLPRSAEMIISLLAVLKAGGAYVPLDPSYPKQRLEFILADTRAAIVITEQELLRTLPDHSAEVICLDRDGDTLPREISLPPGPRPTADSLAYIIYTSGSTGRPKGVAIQHRNAVGLVLWAAQTFTTEQLSSVLVATSICFDLSVFEIFAPLSGGGKLILADNALQLPQLDSSHNVTLVNTVPSVMTELLRMQALPTCVQTVNLAGEPLQPRLVEQLYNLGTVESVMDLYGPSETTTYSTFTRRVVGGQVSVGRPISGTQVYILDRRLNPVPVGTVGEIHIAGAGVARGYLGRPELTAEKFIPDPFSSQAGARFYRTGDLGRWTLTGQIELAGRVDEQVKIRGFRVEPGEIEAVICQHPLVSRALVIVREDLEGNKKLVGYVIAKQGTEVTGAQLRGYLKEKLPEYLVPSAFVLLDEFQLTPSGKIDRRALPAPGVNKSQVSKSYAPPRTPVQKMLVNIWSNLLGIDPVGPDRIDIEDDFFELGGHSLLATQLMSRIKEAFGIEIELRRLFDNPTIDKLSECLEEVMKGAQGEALQPIEHISREESLPLSFAQQRLWFLDRLDPDKSFYNISTAFFITGPLNVEALKRSMTEIVRRHETLRTSFVTIKGEPAQVVAPAQPFELPIINIEGLSGGEEELQRLIAEHTEQPLRLSAGPLLRVILFRLGEREHVFHLTMHHIISDGWSLKIFLGEMTALYQAYSQNQASPLAELPIQYVDFACWQREWMQGEMLKKQLDYWAQQLGGELPVLVLPTDHARPAEMSSSGAHHSFTIPATVSESLNALSRRRDATLFMTLLAAWQVLLSRYSGQEEIIVGVPVAGRTRADIEPLIGLFVNTLVIRTDLSREPDFTEALQRVKEVFLQAYAHQDVPFEKVVDAVQPERDLSRTPLFQVMFNLLNFFESPEQVGRSASALEQVGLQLTPLKIEDNTSKFDLSLIMTDAADGLAGTIEYNTDLFEAATIHRIADHFKALLVGVAESPETPVTRLALLSERELEQILLDWNDTSLDFRLPLLVHHLFEAQVLRSPHSLALVSSHHQLSFSLLNRRANQLARLLLSAGLRPDSLVAICLDRCADMVLSLLAVLKAGAAYLPVDPLLPHHRISFMMEDARARLVITSRSLAHLFGSPVNTLFVEDLDSLIQFDDSNLDIPMSPDNLAYVIYTSGSTGTPKAAMNTHRGLANRQLWMQQACPLSDSDRLLQLSSFSFDFSFWEVLGSLSAGATLVLPDPGSQRDVSLLLDIISDYSVTAAHFVPSQLRAFLSQDGLDRCRCLRTVFAGGEPLTFDLQRRFFDRLTASLHNQYGPTEASIDVTHWHCQPDASNQIVPIGRPIANTRIYILDPSSQPVAQGAIGELCIGGLPVGRGYFNRPDATADKFIPDPFSQLPGARLYRTGDLARYLGDGLIGYHGRIDQQVKVRGFRIELGEIEAALRQHPEVREAVVVARQEAGGDKRLVGYVVGEAGATPKVVELREHVSRLLPEHMVPAAWVMMEGLPLTAGGKLDRRALPEPEQVRPELGSEYREPEGEVEREVAGIWESLLGVERVGAEDNFFELGGHSLLATQAVSRVREVFGVEVPLRLMFEHRTVGAMARAVEEALRGEEGATIKRMERGARSEQMPLSFAQERLWFLDQFEPNNPFYNIPAALRLKGSLNVAALSRSMNEIVRRHEVLRTSFPNVEGQPFQVISPESNIHLPIIDISGLPGEQREIVARQMADDEFLKPFNLSTGPLIRLTLLRLGEYDHVGLLTTHHIVSDGWSIGLLVKELGTLYDVFSNDLPSPLPELPIQYVDFALWQRQWLGQETLEKQLAYWKRQLGGDLPVSELMTDRPRPPVQTSRGASEYSIIPQDLVRSLEALSANEGATLFMTLMAAFQTLLHRYSGQTDLCIGTPIANRDRIEIEELIGFFVNTLVIRGDLSGDPGFRELLGRVREVTLGAYDNQGLPFEKLVEVLQPERDLSRAPLFQVLFALQNAPREDLALPGLTLNFMSFVSTTAKFDLTVVMARDGDALGHTWEYNTDLFDAGTIRRMVGHFENLLRSIVADPETCLSGLVFLSQAEQDQLLREWNDTDIIYDHDACTHHLFEGQVTRTPNSIAAVYGQEEISYAELDNRANQLARHLRRLGVGPDVMVGVCMERSIEMVIGLLGIMKAGGAYVPLDPTYPKNRLAFMLTDTAIETVIAGRGVEEKLSDYTGKIVNLADGWEKIAAGGEADREEGPGAEASGDNIAYVIYTSGSTGKPKGVVMTHRALVNLIEWQFRTAPFGFRTLQFASLNFDASFHEMFSTWRAGGTLVMASDEIRHDVAKLLRSLADGAIERLFIPPVVLQHLAETAADSTPPATLKLIKVAGEQLQITGAITRLFTTLQNCALQNDYGPSESHVVTQFTLAGSPSLWPVFPSIGRPIDNSQIYVLDSHLQPVPVGAPGELYIGGTALARGYLSRPELTAERFIPSPFSDKAGERLYKTGDLSRYLPDGNIEFLGRIRPPGEDSRLPHRDGGGRIRVEAAPGRARGRGDRQGRRARRQAAGGLRGRRAALPLCRKR